MTYHQITEDEATSLEQVAASLDVMMALLACPPADKQELNVLKLSMVNMLWLLHSKLDGVITAYQHRDREALRKSNPIAAKVLDDIQAGR